MKRVIAAVVLLLAAALIAVWTGYAFNGEMDGFEKELNTLVAYSDKITDEKLLEKAGQLASHWDESSGVLRSIVLHEGVDELGRLISSLPQILEHSGRTEMKIKCIEAINLIKNLKSCEKISFENVL